MVLAASAMFGIVMWAGALVGAALLMIVAAAWIRRRTRDVDAPASPPFTLHDLRVLRADGRLTDEEFAKAKDAMLRAPFGKDRGSHGDGAEPTTSSGSLGTDSSPK